jgi:hypothetical protein
MRLKPHRAGKLPHGGLLAGNMANGLPKNAKNTEPLTDTNALENLLGKKIRASGKRLEKDKLTPEEMMQAIDEAKVAIIHEHDKQKNFNLIKRGLRHKDAEVQIHASEALGEIAYDMDLSSAFLKLSYLIRDGREHPAVRAAACNAVKKGLEFRETHKMKDEIVALGFECALCAMRSVVSEGELEITTMNWATRMLAKAANEIYTGMLGSRFFEEKISAEKKQEMAQYVIRCALILDDHEVRNMKI